MYRLLRLFWQDRDVRRYVMWPVLRGLPRSGIRALQWKLRGTRLSFWLADRRMRKAGWVYADEPWKRRGMSRYQWYRAGRP